MKQVLRKGLKQIVVDEVPDPVVTPHHVLVRPLCSLISSGTETASIHQQGLVKEVTDNPSHLRKIFDVARVAGPSRTAAEVRAKFSEYAVLGYSGAGVVVDKHSTVTDVEIGDRVAYGGEGTGHGETIHTGRNLVARIPDSVSFENASFTTLGSIALNAVRTAEIGVGDVVAVLGLGLVGQLVAQLVRLQGGVVIAIDLKQDRVDLATKLGADYGLASGGSLGADVAALTGGRGADVVIVAAASKSAGPCKQALNICRQRGKIVVVGAVEMSFPWSEMYLKEIQLLMARAYGPGSYDVEYEKFGRDYPVSYVRWTENRNMEEFLRLGSIGRVQLDQLITHRFDLQDAARAYQTILDPASGSLAVVLRYPASEDPNPVSSFRPQRKVAAAKASTRGALNVAVIGAGNLARWTHLPNLKKISGAELRSVYSASGARGKSYALRFGAQYCTSSYEEILDDSRVDLVMILSRNQDHASQALTALHAGKHVFVEKPMALTEQECRELVRAVDQSGRQLTVGFNRRFAPFYIEQKRALANRNGAAVINCRMSSPGMSSSYWMSDPAIGGGILGEACHFVDLMSWLLDSEPVSVSAYSLPTTIAEPIGQNNITASFNFADGSIGNLTYCTVGTKGSGGERVEVFAPGISAAVDNFKKLVIHSDPPRRYSRLWPDKGYKSQLESFVAAIQKGSSPEVSVRDGALATVACLRMLESARARQPRAIDFS